MARFVKFVCLLLFFFPPFPGGPAALSRSCVCLSESDAELIKVHENERGGARFQAALAHYSCKPPVGASLPAAPLNIPAARRRQKKKKGSDRRCVALFRTLRPVRSRDSFSPFPPPFHALFPRRHRWADQARPAADGARWKASLCSRPFSTSALFRANLVCPVWLRACLGHSAFASLAAPCCFTRLRQSA